MKIKWLTLPALALLCCTTGASAKEWKELRFGVNPSYPPFESTTADGGVQGFGVDLGNAICAELKLTCVWVSNDFRRAKGWRSPIAGLPRLRRGR